VLKPVPLTVEDAESVVNAPVLGVPEPIAPGAVYTLEASIVLVTVPESPVVTIFPLVAGMLMEMLVEGLGPTKAV
jgi:hypothetical protein